MLCQSIQNSTSPFNNSKSFSLDRCDLGFFYLTSVIVSKAKPYTDYAVRVDGEGHRHGGVNTVGQHRIHKVIRATFQIIRPVLDEVGRFLLIKSVSRQYPSESFVAVVCRNKEAFFGLERLLFHKSFIEQIAVAVAHGIGELAVGRCRYRPRSRKSGMDEVRYSGFSKVTVISVSVSG